MENIKVININEENKCKLCGKTDMLVNTKYGCLHEACFSDYTIYLGLLEYIKEHPKYNPPIEFKDCDITYNTAPADLYKYKMEHPELFGGQQCKK